MKTRILLVGLLVFCVAACGSGDDGGGSADDDSVGDDDAPPPPPPPPAADVNPAGNWAVTDTWGAGSCGITDPATDLFTVTKNADGTYNLAEAEVDSITGSITCNSTACQLSGLITSSGVGDANLGTWGATQSLNYSLSSTFVVSGSGSIDVSWSGNGTTTVAGSCTQQYTASGTKQ
jgi:hypothetical protein